MTNLVKTIRMAEKERRYTKDDLTVIWTNSLCVHSGKCIRGLGQVFNLQNRPWIDLSKADKEAIIKQVDQCPSGALSYELEVMENQMESTGSEVEVEVIENGPLALKSACVITMPDGTEMTKADTAYLCRCGASAKKPFCDGSHKKIGFKG